MNNESQSSLTVNLVIIIIGLIAFAALAAATIVFIVSIGPDHRVDTSGVGAFMAMIGLTGTCVGLVGGMLASVHSRTVRTIHPPPPPPGGGTSSTLSGRP